VITKQQRAREPVDCNLQLSIVWSNV